MAPSSDTLQLRVDTCGMWSTDKPGAGHGGSEVSVTIARKEADKSKAHLTLRTSSQNQEERFYCYAGR